MRRPQDRGPETTFYLVRHGETDYNRKRIMQGRRIDASLNELGRRQAEALGERLAGESFDAVYTSVMKRAIQTADAVAVHHPDVPRFRLPELDEMCWGIWEGEPTSDRLRAMLDEMYAYWDAGDYDYRVEEGESIYDVQERCVRAMGQILDRHAGGRVLVVTHGRLLRVLLASILEVGLERMDEFHHANTCVNLITHRDGAYRSSLLNCIAHLADAESVLLE